MKTKSVMLLLLALVVLAGCAKKGDAKDDKKGEEGKSEEAAVSKKGKWTDEDKTAITNMYKQSWEGKSDEEKQSLDVDKWIPCVMEKLEAGYENPDAVQKAFDESPDEVNKIAEDCAQSSKK